MKAVNPSTPGGGRRLIQVFTGRHAQAVEGDEIVEVYGGLDDYRGTYAVNTGVREGKRFSLRPLAMRRAAKVLAVAR